MFDGQKINPFCICESDGWCPRYGREQRGRFREICAGKNVDLGTAAAFREQWQREAMSAVPHGGEPTKLILKTGQAPGDAVAMTAAIYSLHQAYPGKYATAVESYWPEVFENNPDVVANTVPIDGYANDALPGASPVEMHYPAIHQSNERGIHFMQGWTEFLGMALGINIPLLTNRPRLYFADQEPPVEDYWLVCSGGKKDFTTKLWGHERYQEVVRLLAGKVRFVQVGGSRPTVPWAASTNGSQDDVGHEPLDGAECMVGKTSLRELFDLARRACGILCGVSLLMHVAAAVQRPSVVVAGGREPVIWNSYPLQQYLHTVGVLPCQDAQGRVGGACWRYRTIELGDGTILDKNTCERPVDGTPECMRMITPNQVAELVLRYNRQ